MPLAVRSSEGLAVSSRWRRWRRWCTPLSTHEIKNLQQTMVCYVNWLRRYRSDWKGCNFRFRGFLLRRDGNSKVL